VGVGGPGDLIDGRLLRDEDRFYRIDLGGRPLGMQLADDDRTLYVANYLTNSVQVVDIEDRRIRAQWSLGADAEPTLARRGMAIFYDGRRSLDQWYSCHSCHQNGGANSRPMDTHNDGTENTFKTVLSLYHVTETKPWTWHGWQEDLSDAMHKSLTSTMLGRKPSDEDTQALVAYLDTLQLPPNPFRQPDGSLSDAARRGEQVFHSATAGCANCHSGPLLTDGGIHDVGLGSPSDRYEGFNTPSLRGTYRKVRWLHDGRSRSLHDLLTGPHAPSKVTQEGELSQEQLRDLIEYVKSL
jgi:cytochrome c peroxidase